MSEIKHTPGPWFIENGTIVSSNGDIASVHYQSSRGVEEEKANASLMAAAPDLLEACLQARAALPDAWAAVKCGVPIEVLEILNKAIVKAEGGAG